MHHVPGSRVGQGYEFDNLFDKQVCLGSGGLENAVPQALFDRVPTEGARGPVTLPGGSADGFA
jgi:hypothetical protein